MFIMDELIEATGINRDKFVYIDELYDFKNNKINPNKLQPHHILIINHFFFGINAMPKIRKQRDWNTIKHIVIEFIKSINNKMCLVIFDSHEYSFFGGIKKIAEICNEYNFDYLLILYNQNAEIRLLKTYMESISNNTKIIELNNMIKKDVFKDYGLEKVYDIFFFGARWDSYPLRKKLLRLFNTKRFKNNFRIRVAEFREYNEVGLAKMLNKSWLCVSTMSKFEYLVKKYFEISASKSLILGDMPKQGEEIFGDNYIKLSKNMSEDEMFNVIKNALNDKDDIMRKANINYDTVRSKHTIDVFHQQLYDKIINTI